MRLKIVFFILLFSTSAVIFAQDRKAVNFYNRGEEAYKERNYLDAETFFLKALERYPSYALAYYRLGQISYTSRNISKTKKYYQKLLDIDPGNEDYVLAYTFLGGELIKEMKYEAAVKYLRIALKKTKPKTPAYQQIERQIYHSELAINLIAKPLEIKPRRMSEVLNFKDKQYFPAFTADGNTIYFTARANGGDENIYFSERLENDWATPESLSDLINTNFNEGTCTISADGKTMVFTNCEGRNGFGSCDLYITKYDARGWSVPVNMGPNINSPFWDSQASLSSDGRILVFSSDRYGSIGGKDLYVSQLGAMNEWSRAQNLGAIVNTNRDEVSPFLHANSKSLFFASNGHPGLGGFDLFLAEKEKKGFSVPVNLGFPINDGSDQFALTISANGEQAYYSKEEGDRINLFQFALPIELKEKFNPTFYLKGIVSDADDMLPLGARIQLINLNTKNVVSTFNADETTGEYLAVLPFLGNYGLYIEHPDYFFKSLSFSFNTSAKKSNKELNIALEKIDKEKTEILNNIYFDEASWELKPESLVELSKLAELIWRNPNLKVEISGHTDNVGTGEDNLELSTKRAEAVVAYLVKEGLDSQKLIAKGYGESQPIASNEIANERGLNRRIELRFY